MSIVIAAQTAADTYKFSIPQGQVVLFTGFGFSGGDVITLQDLTISPNTYATAYENGVTITLSSTNTHVHVNGPFIGQWSKGVTTGSVGMNKYSAPVE